MDDLSKAQAAAIDTAAQVSQEGREVRYLRSVFEPKTGHCQCLFDASKAEVVREVNDRAKLPYDSIVEVFNLPNPR